MEAIIRDLASLTSVSTNAKLVELYKYWTEKKRESLFPSRSNIDPLDFVYALGFVSLVDILPASIDSVPRGHTYKYRLVSTTVTNRLGYDMTGKWADQIPNAEIRSYVKGFYDSALIVRKPIYEQSERAFNYRIWKHEALALPLSDDNENINMLLVYRENYDPKFAFEQDRRAF